MKRKAKPKAKDAALLAGLRIRVGLLTKQLGAVRRLIEAREKVIGEQAELIETLKQRVRDEAAARRKMAKVEGGGDGGAEELTKARSELTKARSGYEAASAAYETVSAENAALRAQVASAAKRDGVEGRVARFLTRMLRARVAEMDAKYATAISVLAESGIEIDDEMRAAFGELEL